VRWKEGLLFWRLGQQVDTSDGRGGADNGKKEERERQVYIGERWGKWLGASVGSAGPGADKGDVRKDARAVRANAFQSQI
jgi:hypothetical protein